jgi:uncharacterized protein
MTRRSVSLLPVLAAALWPAQGQAQAGPSFNCADSDTATELAICGSPELSQLELQMFASYLRLVDAVGERRARNIADRFLERRQACGADEACIAERLQITLRVFERRAGGDVQLAAREPSEEELVGRDAPSAVEQAPAIIEAPAISEPPTEEEFASIAAPPVRPDWLAFIEPQAEPPLASEPELALDEPAALPLEEEDLALAPEPVSPIEAPAPAEDNLALAPEPVSPVEVPAAPEDDLASADLPAAEEPVDPDLPLAAQAPLPSDLDSLLEEGSTEVASAEPPPPSEERPLGEQALTTEEVSGAIDDAELASSDQAATEEATVEPAETDPATLDEAAPFDTPLSWAFMDLIRHQRSEIQTRLQAAGFYDGSGDGSWDQATLAAVKAFFASEEGASFDATTESGAALAFDFIRSDAFAEAHGLPPDSAEEPEAAPDPNDPLASTDW